MKKNLTLLVFDTTGTPVRQTTIPRMLLPMAGLLLMGIAIVLYLVISDYQRLKVSAKDAQGFRAALQLQKEQSLQQQEQIISFANKIGALKAQLADLQSFENKIRIIANLEAGKYGSSMFGVGGSGPEDQDPAIMLEQGYQDLIRNMHAEINEIDQASRNQNESFSSIFNQLEGKRNLLAATPSIRPVKGWVSSRFGYRTSPFTSRREFHRGLDIATHAGTPIIAPADGLITYSGKKGLMGNMITIEHGFGLVTRYGHIQKLLKKKRDRVKRGETIALVGNTGRSTGPHLHYEVRLNGVAVNPTKYFFN